MSGRYETDELVPTDILRLAVLVVCDCWTRPVLSDHDDIIKSGAETVLAWALESGPPEVLTCWNCDKADARVLTARGLWCSEGCEAAAEKDAAIERGEAVQ